MNYATLKTISLLWSNEMNQKMTTTTQKKKEE